MHVLSGRLARLSHRRLCSSVAPSFKFAVVGCGPAGFYTTQRILKHQPDAKVDMFDRLPVPFGLVRFGVAPDHPETKNVENQFADILRDDRCRFFGNVRVGRDVGVAELSEHYTAVVYTYGSGSESKLGVAGEDMPGVFSAGRFVYWYSGHPDFVGEEFGLSTVQAAAVVGMGNVALDVARILLKSVDELKSTCMSEQALAQLATSDVREVHVVGRRGPVEASFTNAELREIINGPWRTYLEPADISLDLPPSVKERAVKRKLALLEKVSRGPHDPVDLSKRKLVFHFLRSPLAFCGNERVEGVELGHNLLGSGEDGRTRAEPTGERSFLPTQLVLKSTGYKSEPLNGLPFDSRANHIPNALGRVEWPEHFPGATPNNTYVAGWIKRGPSGIIGTNLFDAQQTADTIMADLDSGTLVARSEHTDVAKLLQDRGVRFVDVEGWSKIAEYEQQNGAAQGKPLLKILSIEEMLARAAS